MTPHPDTGLGAIVFDLDGCLVDSEPLVLSVIAEEMRALGVSDAHADEIRDAFLGASMARIREHVAARRGAPCPEDFGDRVEARLVGIYPDRLRLSPGAEALLDRLNAAGIPCAIATGGSRRRLDFTLEAAGLATRFAGRSASAEEVARGKPAPDVFLRAASLVGAAPECCAVVEDSPHGIAGAVAAGMHAIGYIGGSHLDGISEVHAARLTDAGAEIVLDELGAVTAALLAPRSLAAGKDRP